MINKSRKLKFLSLPLAAIGLLLVGGESAKVFAQRDPFAKPAASAPRSSAPSKAPSSPSAPSVKPKPAGPTAVMAPPIQDRIGYYKRLREAAAMNNQPLPKVTSVLTLDEMSVTGIFRTSRGYAALVEAKPIKLSYTIYPGEKFFDGQLVAIEENKLVFRRVTKMTNGKFIAAEENKPLREYTVDQEVQGTAPIEPSGKTESAANAAPANPTDDKTKPANSAVISSPLEEMNKQSAEPKDFAKSKPNKKVRTSSSGKKSTAKTSSSAKTEKKSVKVATNTDQ